MLKTVGLLAMKMTELVEAEGRLAKSEVHQLTKAFMLYLVSGVLIVLGVLALVAGFYHLMLMVMPTGAAMIVGALMLIVVSAGFASHAQRYA